MIRRKDSMSFAEFMRGKYDIDNEEYLGRLIQNMTLKEQGLIACEPFESLWKQKNTQNDTCQSIIFFTRLP